MGQQHKKISRFFLAILFVAGWFWFVTLYHFPVGLNILSLKYVRPISTSFMRHKSFTHPLKRCDYHWVGSDKISKYLKDAVVVSEDDRFFEHPGLDWKAIKWAAKKNWKRKSFDFGASTITMQLAKNLYLYPYKDPFRKVREGVLAVILDAYLSKERILEIYLNIAEWGPGIYGAEAAAQHYFGGKAKNLSASQAAFLASILPNPTKNGKAGYRLNGRAQSILKRIQ